MTAPAPFGGLESVVTALARGHAAMGHAVHVVSVLDPGTPHAALAEGIPGVTAHRLEVGPRAYLRERAAVTAIAREAGADVLHTHGHRSDFVDGGVAGRLGIPAVTTLHGYTGLGGRKGRLGEWLQTRALRRFDAVVAVSRPIVDRVVSAGVPASRVHLIRNAWSPAGEIMDRARARARLGLPAEGLVAGWVGRLSREKAPDVFLEALGILAADAPLTVFVGDGPEAPALRGRAAELGLEGRVRWAGRVEGAAALLAAFDVFVLSSRTEGTPIVLFEAMAAGVPVVATRVGGVPDVVSEREALLVPPEDPATLAAAVRTALADPGSARTRAVGARARLGREFAVQPWLESYERLYREVVGANRLR